MALDYVGRLEDRVRALREENDKLRNLLEKTWSALSGEKIHSEDFRPYTDADWAALQDLQPQVKDCLSRGA